MLFWKVTAWATFAAATSLQVLSLAGTPVPGAVFLGLAIVATLAVILVAVRHPSATVEGGSTVRLSWSRVLRDCPPWLRVTFWAIFAAEMACALHVWRSLGYPAEWSGIEPPKGAFIASLYAIVAAFTYCIAVARERARPFAP